MYTLMFVRVSNDLYATFYTEFSLLSKFLLLYTGGLNSYPLTQPSEMVHVLTK